MKDLIVEIKKAVKYRDEAKESKFLYMGLLVYLVNKWDYNSTFDYWEGKETATIYKGRDLVGILHSKFPIGFIHESVYEDFNDLNFYHLVKVSDFEKAEWSVDLQEMKSIASEITWYDTDEKAVSSKKFSISDFKYAAN